MTVWERIRVLTENEPHITFQNWGAQLDGAGIVTGILNIKGRDVALYGHDFTVRAGSMDATNGAKLCTADSDGRGPRNPSDRDERFRWCICACRVGGLDGYSEAFQAMRKISGVVPSIMLMFGYNAGGGATFRVEGSFLIQPNETFFRTDRP